MSDKNIVNLYPNKFEEELKELAKNMDVIIESTKLHAKIRKAAFDEYISQGFTEEQALAFCVAI